MMKKPFTAADIAELNRLHHLLHRKMAASHWEDAYPHLKGLTTLEIGIIGALSGKPEATPTELAEALQVSKSTLTSAINRLETRGYLGREISPADRRSFRLVLAGEGKLAQGEHLASERAIYTRLLGLLDSGEETASLLALARKIAERF